MPLLLDNGANIEAKNTEGKTPLIRALSRGHENIVFMFLDAGADINARNKINGSTSLHKTASYGHTAVIQLLLEREAKLTRVTTTGKLLSTTQ
jgi:ankyrin repeat protein